MRNTKKSSHSQPDAALEQQQRERAMARAPSMASRQQQRKSKARDTKPRGAASTQHLAAAHALSPAIGGTPDKQTQSHAQTATNKKTSGGGGGRCSSNRAKGKIALHSTKPRACPVQNLPSEMVALLFPFLAWKDTSAASLVSTHWRRVVLANKRAHFEWKSTVLVGRNAGESLEMLLRNERGCLDARFAPTLVLINVGSGDSTAFKTGGYWKSLAQALESAQLVPRGCPVVTLFTPMGVMGTGGEAEPSAAREYEEELGEYGDSPSKTMTLSITVAHLPDTTVETATFDRKWLRQQARGRGEDAEYPFTSIAATDREYADTGESGDSVASSEMPSFLLFSVNANSSEELAPIVTKWHPGAPVVGGIFPFADRCIPMALYMRGSSASRQLPAAEPARDTQPRKHPLARKAKQMHQQRHRQQASSSSASAAAVAASSAGTLEFPTNLLVRFHGQVGMRVFASCGFHPITPVVRCETISTAYLLDQFAHYRAYETVLWRNPLTGEEVQYRLIDLLRQYGSFTRENSLNIYTSASIEPMEMIVQASKECNESELVVAPPVAETIDRLDMLICTADGDVLSMDKHWEVGRFGFVAVQIPECGKFAHSVALKSLQKRMAAQKETPLGAFMITCALKGQELYGAADVETKIYEQIFPGLPLTGCFSGGEVGPVAYPLGLPSTLGANRPQLQSNTTSGAIFYVKHRPTAAAAGRLPV